jgi:hypothetical protein
VLLDSEVRGHDVDLRLDPEELVNAVGVDADAGVLHRHHHVAVAALCDHPTERAN